MIHRTSILVSCLFLLGPLHGQGKTQTLMDAHRLRQDGKKEDALAAYSAVSVAKTASAQDRGGAKMWVAHLHREAGRPAPAREAYAGVVNMADAHPHDRGGSLFWLGELMRQQGELALARDVFAAVARMKGVHERDLRLATKLAGIGGLPAADPRLAQEHLIKGYEALGRGDAAAAKAALTQALACGAGSTQAASARNQLANQLQPGRRFQECRAVLGITLRDPEAKAQTRAEAQYLLAHSWINEGNWPAAYEAWAKLLETEGTTPAERSEATMIVGSGLLQAGEYERARKMFARCLGIDEGERWHKWDAREGIAQAWRKEGNEDRAAKALNELLKDPGLPEDRRERARKALESLH